MSYEKNLNQIKNKPLKLAKYEKFNKSKKRTFGKNIHRCRKCGKSRGVIRQHGLLYCRQCFREEAQQLGFKKYN